jgi:hypothetical protein
LPLFDQRGMNELLPARELERFEMVRTHAGFSLPRSARLERAPDFSGIARAELTATMPLLCLNSERNQPKRSNSNSHICCIVAGFVGLSWSATAPEFPS